MKETPSKPLQQELINRREAARKIGEALKLLGHVAIFGIVYNLFKHITKKSEETIKPKIEELASQLLEIETQLTTIEQSLLKLQKESKWITSPEETLNNQKKESLIGQDGMLKKYDLFFENFQTFINQAYPSESATFSKKLEELKIKNKNIILLVEKITEEKNKI